LELLKGFFEVVGSLAGPEEHGGLVEVEDDVVEQEVADLEEDVAGLHLFIGPTEKPVGIEAFDGFRVLASELEALGDEDAVSGVRGAYRR
jgi:hypothetical protein